MRYLFYIQDEYIQAKLHDALRKKNAWKNLYSLLSSFIPRKYSRMHHFFLSGIVFSYFTHNEYIYMFLCVSLLPGLYYFVWFTLNNRTKWKKWGWDGAEEDAVINTRLASPWASNASMISLKWHDAIRRMKFFQYRASIMYVWIWE